MANPARFSECSNSSECLGSVSGSGLSSHREAVAVKTRLGADVGIRPEQVEAAGAIQKVAASDSADGVRVVAGPGTGKSFTIEERVCWLLNHEIAADAIAAVSFTRASAADLQARVLDACIKAGHPDAGIRVTTLHALALRSLRAAGALEAYPVDPTVLDKWELRNIYDDELVAWLGSKASRVEKRFGKTTRRFGARLLRSAVFSGTSGSPHH